MSELDYTGDADVVQGALDTNDVQDAHTGIDDVHVGTHTDTNVVQGSLNAIFDNIYSGFVSVNCYLKSIDPIKFPAAEAGGTDVSGSGSSGGGGGDTSEC
jgi:hypothetical protein